MHKETGKTYNPNIKEVNILFSSFFLQTSWLDMFLFVLFDYRDRVLLYVSQTGLKFTVVAQAGLVLMILPFFFF